MKEFINQKYQLAKIEKDIAEIRILEKQKHDEIESWGKKYFTKSVRENIIEAIKADEEQNRILPSLIECNEKWESGQITYTDVITFSTYDSRIQEIESKDYSHTFISRIHKIILGGGTK
ncbi:hypothetical protein NSQ91_14040 [Paenibacillus sp. FSL R7-0048]|uniref:hypothetical protein n=1 Tax=Paenibacillus TaxID=44249 RepID=UPI00096FFEF9|nr:hypothetical protein [Paenibacillus odorifer]OMD87808.1 hypothetical protein BSK53_02125 [Paenibacillus odorifer]